MHFSEGHVQHDGHDLNLTPTTLNATTRTLALYHHQPTYSDLYFVCVTAMDCAICLSTPPPRTGRFNTLLSTINNAPNLLSDRSVELLRGISIDIVLILSPFRSYEPNFFTLHYTCSNIEQYLYFNLTIILFFSLEPSPLFVVGIPHHTSC